jgi:hypothetical protein
MEIGPQVGDDNPQRGIIMGALGFQGLAGLHQDDHAIHDGVQALGGSLLGHDWLLLKVTGILVGVPLQ